jgi:GntR family transcriptional regulator, rspAB operon transcriptional repressor
MKREEPEMCLAPGMTGSRLVKPRRRGMSREEARLQEARVLQPVDVDNLADRVFEQIRAAITSKTLEPGARLTEVRLAADLNVSKTPVREALLRLRELGLIEPDGRRGGRVVQPSKASYGQMHEIREALEVYAALVASDRAEGADRRAIRGHAQESYEGAQAGDVQLFRTADAAFHEAIANATRNPRLITQIRNAVDLIAALRERDFPHGGASIQCGAAHVAIADAIVGGDGPTAAELMRVHVRYVRDITLSQMA